MNDKELDDLIRQHRRKLQAFVARRVSNREDAEDIVQYTFLQLLGAHRQSIASDRKAIATNRKTIIFY